jgi:hypothetical protein
MTNVISAAFPYHKQRRRVLGCEMAYVEVGQGDPIVLCGAVEGAHPRGDGRRHGGTAFCCG